MIKPPLKPSYAAPFNQVTVCTASDECLGIDTLTLSTNATGAAWTANLCVYVPLITSNQLVVSHFFWVNGATVNGNTDVGIYSADGTTKLVSTGATANAGTNVAQSVDVTNVTLAANSRFWLALGSDSGTQTYFLDPPSTLMLEFMGVRQQASGYSSGLPSSASLDAPSVAVVPLFGFSGASVF